MPRLFVALDLPEAIRDEMANWVKSPSPAVRPVAKENLHLTLHFLGECDLESTNIALAKTRKLSKPLLVPAGHDPWSHRPGMAGFCRRRFGLNEDDRCGLR